MITVDLSKCRWPAGSRILDIGCGAGRHTAAAYGLKKAVVIGADPNQQDLAHAKQRLLFHQQTGVHGGGRWNLARADITALPFKDASFDGVICSEVLEHIPDYRKALRETSRVLRPGGHLLISVPRRWPETICWLLSRTYRTEPGGHLRVFTARALVRQVKALGYSLRRRRHAHGLHTPYWWLKCLAGDRLVPGFLAKRYHRLLTWDIMTKPRLTRRLDHLLNPFIGKSVVFYFNKKPWA